MPRMNLLRHTKSRNGQPTLIPLRGCVATWDASRGLRVVGFEADGRKWSITLDRDSARQIALHADKAFNPLD